MASSTNIMLNFIVSTPFDRILIEHYSTYVPNSVLCVYGDKDPCLMAVCKRRVEKRREY